MTLCGGSLIAALFLGAKKEISLRASFSMMVSYRFYVSSSDVAVFFLRPRQWDFKEERKKRGVRIESTYKGVARSPFADLWSIFGREPGHLDIWTTLSLSPCSLSHLSFSLCFSFLFVLPSLLSLSSLSRLSLSRSVCCLSLLSLSLSLSLCVCVCLSLSLPVSPVSLACVTIAEGATKSYVRSNSVGLLK